jgi:hypothetical protein
VKVNLTIQEDDVRTAESFGDHVVVEGACPKCKATPFSAAGTGMSIESHDTYRAEGACLSCKKRVGVLRVVVSTIFGLEEDERVLYGSPCKVY